jgi:hypothetical protein
MVWRRSYAEPSAVPEFDDFDFEHVDTKQYRMPRAIRVELYIIAALLIGLEIALGIIWWQITVTG